MCVSKQLLMEVDEGACGGLQIEVDCAFEFSEHGPEHDKHLGHLPAEVLGPLLD